MLRAIKFVIDIENVLNHIRNSQKRKKIKNCEGIKNKLFNENIKIIELKSKILS